MKVRGLSSEHGFVPGLIIGDARTLEMVFASGWSGMVDEVLCEMQYAELKFVPAGCGRGFCKCDWPRIKGDAREQMIQEGGAMLCAVF